MLGADLTGTWYLGVLIGMAAGGLLALIHAIFSVSLRADQIVSGTALNFLAFGITTYLYLNRYGAEGTPTDLPQGRQDARYRADLGLRYQLMDNRASVRLSLRDPFSLQGSSSRLGDRDYILIGRSEESTRSAQINVTYALGRRGGGGVRGGR